LQVLGSSVKLTGNVLNATVIEGHATAAVNVVRMGEITFSGPHKIRNSGNAGADPTLQGEYGWHALTDTESKPRKSVVILGREFALRRIAASPLWVVAPS
jgi:hypothetical protein